MAFDPSGGSGGHRGPPAPGDAVPPWWEDDRGWNEDDGWGGFPRRRRSRVLKWTGIAVAGALVLGSAGSLVGVLLRGASPVALPVGNPGVAQTPGSTRRVDVNFVVTNPTGSAVTPVCDAVVVLRGERAIWHAWRVTVPTLAPDASESRGFVATVPSALPAGAQAVVTCRS